MSLKVSEDTDSDVHSFGGTLRVKPAAVYETVYESINLLLAEGDDLRCLTCSGDLVLTDVSGRPEFADMVCCDCKAEDEYVYLYDESPSRAPHRPTLGALSLVA